MPAPWLYPGATFVVKFKWSAADTNHAGAPRPKTGINDDIIGGIAGKHPRCEDCRSVAADDDRMGVIA
jgi:hypothetical protein